MTIQTKNIFIAAFVGLMLVVSGCSKSGSSGGSASPADQPFTAEGTVTAGGGGNGIDGKPIESFAKRIDELPEYRRHIAPILAQMSAGRPDVLLVYLRWAVRNKSWYFVPRELSKLPQERISLAFQSDQLALHSDKEVFIYEPTYRKNPSDIRAELLMHEMVMSAKLLMKKSPAEQCEALVKAGGNECNSPEFKAFETAWKEPANQADLSRLDGAEHQSVRSMTVFLRSKNQDLSRLSIASARRRLGFNFPWEGAISSVTGTDLVNAIKIAWHSRTKFVPTYKRKQSSDYFYHLQPQGIDECLVTLEPTSQKTTYVFLDLLKIDSPQNRALIKKDDTIYSSWTYGTASDGTERLLGGRSSIFLHINESQPIGRGAMIESHGPTPVDVVTMIGSEFLTGLREERYRHRMSFVLSRDKRPRLLEIRRETVHTVEVVNPKTGEKENEFVPVEGADVVCRPERKSAVQ